MLTNIEHEARIREHFPDYRKPCHSFVCTDAQLDFSVAHQQILDYNFLSVGMRPSGVSAEEFIGCRGSAVKPGQTAVT